MINKQITIGSLFSGIGGFELGLERAIANSKTIWQCEQNAFAQKVLKKHWPDVPIYDDIKEIKHGSIDVVDIICGGFPCQDISQAGKGKGIANGDRSGLWFEMLRIIDIVQPRIAIAENVTAITQKGRGMDLVISSLSKIGYDVEWIDVRASDEGAPHKRERIFFVAYTNMQHIKTQSIHTKPMESESLFECGSGENGRIHERNYWKTTPIESPLCRMDDGISNRMDRIRALGNAIVPQCSETIGRYIMKSGILDDIEEYRKIQKEINNIPW
jgi:DNA (cytosine-5)-methyltransferase 1